MESPVAVDAQFGAMGQDPQLTLGGTEIIPLADSEDAHVLETAIAGQAHILVTANFRDFRFKDIEVITPERHGRYQLMGDALFTEYESVVARESILRQCPLDVEEITGLL